MAKTLYEKLWQSHLVHEQAQQASLLYVDRHLVHEVTSPQAFEGLRLNNRQVRQPKKAIATVDHAIPTLRVGNHIEDAVARLQVETLAQNCQQNNIELLNLGNIYQGIVHIIAPESGLTLPGMVIVCGDSHTSTHGAFGALAFGIGTSEVEHVLVTQSLPQFKSKTMQIYFNGQLAPKCTAKDLVLSMIGKIGTSGGSGYVVEYAGPAIEALSMEGRMTVCNMSIEGGAKAGMIAPDETTFAYIQNKRLAPKGELWDKALAYWKTLPTEAEASFDKRVVIEADQIAPQVTWGTTPEQVSAVTGQVPKPQDFADPGRRNSCQKALEYMGLSGGESIVDIELDYVFIGSCTNSRIEDLRAAAAVVNGHKLNKRLQGIVVPGSGVISQQAEQEGLHEVFLEAGFEWRKPGCSMCLAMNGDALKVGQRCASTSNRNFEGRQGKGGRTHLVSPAMAAAAAIEGRFVDIRNF